MFRCPEDHLRGYLVICLFAEAHFRKHPKCKLRVWIGSYSAYSDIRCLSGLCRFHELLGLLRTGIHDEIRLLVLTSVTAPPRDFPEVP